MKQQQPDLRAFTAKVLIVAAIVVLLLLAWEWRHALLLVFASILIAAGLTGLAGPLGRILHIGPKWGLLPALVLLVGTIAGIGFLFGAQITSQITALADSLPGAFASLRERVAETEIGRRAISALEGGGQQGGALSGIAGRISSFGMSFAASLLDAFLVVVAGIFLALEPKTYSGGLLRLTPPAVRDRAREALEASGRALQKWLVGVLFSMAAIASMISLGLWALGVPAALGLGLVAGLAQFVPFVGPILAAAPAILLAFTIDPLTAGLVVLLYFTASTIEADILYPMIQKKAVQQPPVITLYSIIAFGLLFGPLGVLLAVPLAIVLTIVIDVFYVRGALGEQVHLPGQ